MWIRLISVSRELDVYSTSDIVSPELDVYSSSDIVSRELDVYSSSDIVSRELDVYSRYSFTELLFLMSFPVLI